MRRESIALSVTESSQAGEARRMATGLAADLGFSETERGKVAIVVTETAHNLVRHAREGEIVMRPLRAGDLDGIEILALDKGPGMTDVSRCLRDGYSTAGTPGTGLGAIQRLSSLLDIYSTPDGTALLCRMWARPLPKQPAETVPEVGAVCLPKPGEQVCGDCWAVSLGSSRCAFLVADGLGHGPMAASASHEAARVFEQNAQYGPTRVIEAAHAAMRSTRGAAVAVAELDLETRTVRFVGIGNIAGLIVAPGVSRSLVSYNGIVGHEVHRVQEFSYSWPPGAALIMNSDGLVTQLKLERYPGLLARHPAIIAGVLYRDFKRGRDDATVLVVKDIQG